VSRCIGAPKRFLLLYSVSLKAGIDKVDFSVFADENMIDALANCISHGPSI
jgi:hypothetical protein